MPDGHHHVDRPNPVGPDGFTRLAGDVPNAYAAFVGAEAELARLRSALERILDYWDGRPLLAYHGHHIYAELVKALSNEESDQ